VTKRRTNNTVLTCVHRWFSSISSIPVFLSCVCSWERNQPFSWCANYGSISVPAPTLCVTALSGTSPLVDVLTTALDQFSPLVCYSFERNQSFIVDVLTTALYQYSPLCVTALSGTSRSSSSWVSVRWSRVGSRGCWTCVPERSELSPSRPTSRTATREPVSPLAGYCAICNKKCSRWFNIRCVRAPATARI